MVLKRFTILPAIFFFFFSSSYVSFRPAEPALARAITYNSKKLNMTSLPFPNRTPTTQPPLIRLNQHSLKGILFIVAIVWVVASHVRPRWARTVDKLLVICIPR